MRPLHILYEQRVGADDVMMVKGAKVSYGKDFLIFG
jgi:hypothetical protein